METIKKTLMRLSRYLNLFNPPGEAILAATIQEILSILNNFEQRIEKLEKKGG